jgi:uncharacterized radical SAM superfamily Fe-S cluster-containing enzyme
MLDAVVANEGQPDVVQISGGEPTLHPEFFAILDAARARPIRHLMLNTNGLRIANEPGFAERLAAYQPGFEIYLQWDSFERNALMTLRGADLRQVRERAIERLNAAGVSTTLVVTVARGVNEQELGRILEFAMRQPCVRGVTFQPIQFAGRTDGVAPAENRLTLTELRQLILDQCPSFTPEDLIPVPCNPDALAMAYALKTAEGIAPLTRFIGPDVLLKGERNTIVFESDPAVKEQVFRLFSTSQGPEGQAGALSDLLCCLPAIQAPSHIGYKDVFRVLIMAFMDAVNFDVRAMKKSCVHIAQPDGRIIPFESFNLFYRGERTRLLEERRRETDLAFGRKPVIPVRDVSLQRESK